MLLWILVSVASAADVPTKLPDPPVAGRQHYQEHCWPCHGKAAMGDGPSTTLFSPQPAPALAGMPAAQWDDARGVILAGRGAMPGYAAVLSAGEIDHILLWLSDLDAETGKDPHAKPPKKTPKRPRSAASGRDNDDERDEAGEDEEQQGGEEEGGDEAGGADDEAARPDPEQGATPARPKPTDRSVTPAPSGAEG